MKLPRYLSSWELKFFKWCDRNPNVLCWTSESISLPYISPVDGKLHRYIVDNVVHIKEGDNIKRYLIEIKPHKQTRPPTTHGNKKRATLIHESMTWEVNKAKWGAADAWCKKHGLIFQIITEKQFQGFIK